MASKPAISVIAVRLCLCLLPFTSSFRLSNHPSRVQHPHQHHPQAKQSTPNPGKFLLPSKQLPIWDSRLSVLQEPTTETSTETPSSSSSSSSSARLAKAQRLLSEFSTDNTYENIVNQGNNESNANVNANTSANANANTSTNPPPAKSPGDADSTTAVSTAATEDVVVADSLWTNGHLSPSQNSYVTRWVNGAKVAEPVVQYDPITAEKLLFRQPTKWIIRNAQIAIPLGLWVGGVLFDFVRGVEESNRRQRAIQLLDTIKGLGPAIIKGGQALSSRPDLMASEYLEELQKLQDDVPTYSNALAFSTVEEELGNGIRFNDVFELIEEEPVAAASIGQVYKARLRENGDTVAIKIQRPNCEEVISLDLYVLRWWSGLANVIIDIFGRDIDVQNIIDQFGELIYRELDYVAEAANAQRFTELYVDIADVFVPKVYNSYTTRKVLTMEWVDGFRLTDSTNLDANGLDRKKLVDTLIQCSLRQILENGFFHADPHGGNLLACADGRLCYLDFGMMSYAAAEQRNGFLLAVVHIVNRDWNELVNLYVKLGFIPEGTDLTPIEQGLENALPDVLNADVTELNFKNVVGKLGDIMYTYPFSLPPFYIAIIRCLGVLEGLAIQVDPQSRVISKAYPYVASRVLTDSQGELKEALKRLALTNDGHIRWDRLEGLLDKAQDSRGYDVTLALDQLADYLISSKGEQLLSDLADEIVEGAESLGVEVAGYILEASQALLSSDELSVVTAFRRVQTLIESRVSTESSIDNDGTSPLIQEVLPPLTPTMERILKIASLIGAQVGGAGDDSSLEDVTKFVPLIRKLSSEPRLQRTASEIIARLGERVLSRSLRLAFGLPAPVFDRRGGNIADNIQS